MLRPAHLVALAALSASAALADQIAFAPAATLATGQRPGGVALADLDGDGDRDALITTDAPDRLNLLTNNAGVLTAAGAIALPNGAGAGSVVEADVDNDGDLDVAVAYQNFNQVQIFINTAGVLTPGATIATAIEPRSLIAAQLNADNRIDLACISRDDNAITIMRNTAAGWVASSVATGVEPYAVAAADMDNDGDLDLVASHHRDRAVGVYTNTAGTFARTATLAVSPTVRPDGIALADFNRDGRVDIATTTDNNGVGFVTLFTATAAGFAPFINFATLGANPGPIIAFDADADGDADLAVLNQDSAQMSVFANTRGAATALFAAPVLFATGTTPDSFAIANISGTSAPDILVANRDSNNLSLFVNLVVPPVTCDSIDFNNNSLFPEDQDLVDFFSVFAGGPCSTTSCGDIDFNNNGLFPEDADVISFLRVLAGGACQ